MEIFQICCSCYIIVVLGFILTNNFKRQKDKDDTKNNIKKENEHEDTNIKEDE